MLALSILLAALNACSESSQCRGELADVGASCPATYDGTAALPECPGTFRMQRAYRCGDLVALVRGGGSECYYAMSSHQLVGALSPAGLPSDCDVTAGRAATSCEAEPFAEAAC